MIVLVKSNEFLKLFTTDDFVSFVSRLESYNPEAKVIQYYDGLQKTVKEINKIFENKQGWIQFSKDNVIKIEDIILADENAVLSQLIEFIEKRCKFIQNKIKKHISDWIENEPDWKLFQECMNFTSGFDLQTKQYEYLKQKNPEVYKKAVEYNSYVINLHNLATAKWNVKRMEPSFILPDLEVSHLAYWEKENELVRQDIQINNKIISYMRNVETIPGWKHKTQKDEE